jgi:hypothetical protein
MQLPALLILVAIVTVVTGVILYRRASKSEQSLGSSSSGAARPRTAAGTAHYRSRVVRPSASTATNPPVSGLDAGDDLEAGSADTATNPLQKTASQTSMSSVSSVDSWARNNNVDLFDDTQPV